MMSSNYLIILKKELYSYFVSPLFYGVIVIFLILSGYFFYTDLCFYNMLNIRGLANPIEGFFRRYFNDLRFVLMLLMPLVTMKLFAEEKKLGTFELLIVNPLKDIEILVSKFMASIVIFILLLFLTISNISLLIWFWGVNPLQPLIPSILSGYLGLFLLGLSLISCGIFISSLTYNQAVAGIVTLGIFIFFWFLTWNEMILNKQHINILIQFSLFDRLHGFFKGIIQVNDVVFFLFFSFFFLFLTYFILRSRTWRKV